MFASFVLASLRWFSFTEPNIAMSSDPSRNRSALRPFEILEVFRAAGKPLYLSEIARLADIPISTCHGVLRALEQGGYLYFLSSKEAYPTRRLLEMVRTIEANDPIAARLLPHLENLRDQTHETVVLAALQNDHAVYLAVVESDQSIRYASRPGDVRTLHGSAMGKAMLMSMPKETRAQRIEKLKLKPVTDLTITSQRLLLREIQDCVARGYSVARGENSPDVTAIAMPLRISGMTLAISVAGPRARIDSSESVIVQHLKRCVDGI